MRKLAMLLALLALGCDVRGRVLFVGDSNIALNADVFVGYLYAGHSQGTFTWTEDPPGYLATFAAASGGAFKHRSGDMDWVESLEAADAAHSYDAVVLALGLNDAAAGDCNTNIPASIADVLGALPDTIPVIVLDVPNVPSENYNDGCISAVNTYLAAATTASRFHHISVDTVLGTLASNQRYEADGIHYTDAGAVKLAQAIVTVLDGL